MKRKASEVNQPEHLIPDNERWLHEPEVSAKIDRALEWARKTPLRDSQELLEEWIQSICTEDEN